MFNLTYKIYMAKYHYKYYVFRKLIRMIHHMTTATLTKLGIKRQSSQYANLN